MVRKLIIPEHRHKAESIQVSVIPTLDALVSDAMSIIGTELAFYRAKTARGARLDIKEAKVIRDYVEALVKLSKEAREVSSQQDLSNMSNEALLQLALKLTNKNETETTEAPKPERDLEEHNAKLAKVIGEAEYAAYKEKDDSGYKYYEPEDVNKEDLKK